MSRRNADYDMLVSMARKRRSIMDISRETGLAASGIPPLLYKIAKTKSSKEIRNAATYYNNEVQRMRDEYKKSGISKSVDVPEYARTDGDLVEFVISKCCMCAEYHDICKTSIEKLDNTFKELDKMKADAERNAHMKYDKQRSKIHGYEKYILKTLHATESRMNNANLCKNLVRDLLGKGYYPDTPKRIEIEYNLRKNENLKTVLEEVRKATILKYFGKPDAELLKICEACRGGAQLTILFHETSHDKAHNTNPGVDAGKLESMKPPDDTLKYYLELSAKYGDKRNRKKR